MSNKLKVIPRITRLANYLEEIEKGKLQVPLFQRDYIWAMKQRVELFESLEKGYPIGSLLFWQPENNFEVKKEIGPYEVNVKNAEGRFYILDGFQRMTTLFGCLINPNKTNLPVNHEKLKNFTIYYDLLAKEFIVPRTNSIEPTYLPVNILIDTFELLDYIDNLRRVFGDNKETNELITLARKLASTIFDYQLPTVQIYGGTIEDAVDIFSRVNSKGSKISKDWMVSALTYNEEKDFRLGTKIDNLINHLELYNYQKIKRGVILQCIQNSFGKIYFDEKINDLVNKQNFIEITEKTITSIDKAIKFLFEELLVIDSRLLPYNNQLIFITYFFNEVEEPSEKQIEQLKKWFWVTTYSNYFTYYSLSKQRQAFEQFKAFIKGENDNPVFNDKPKTPFVVADLPKKINFGSVRAKALVLFLLNHANDFKKVSVEEVDGLKIYYLFKESKAPEGVVPVINYLGEYATKNLIKNKPKDLSVLFEREDFDYISQKYLLFNPTKDMSQEEILDKRKELIEAYESHFTEEKLGLKWS